MNLKDLAPLMAKTAPPKRDPVPPVAGWRVRLANALHPLDPPDVWQRGGRWMRFTQQRDGGWAVISQRGGMHMGRIEWSHQWRAYKFVSDSDAVWNALSLADVYAFMKELGQKTGRFV